MKKKLLTLSVLSAFAFAPTVALAGDKDGDNVDTEAKLESSEAMQALALAGQLAALGESQKDAVLLAAALRLQNLVDVEDGDHEKRAEGDSAKGDGAPAEGADIAALAREYAGENAELQAVVAMASQAVDGRGAAGGPKRDRDVVFPGDPWIYTITFNGGEPAEVLVEGDGNADLDVYVFDENDNLICKDELVDALPLCEWQPRWTGPFEIHVVNAGSRASRYDFYTN